MIKNLLEKMPHLISICLNGIDPEEWLSCTVVFQELIFSTMNLLLLLLLLLLLAEFPCHRKWEPIDAKKIGYDISVPLTAHTDWQGGTKYILQGRGQGIQDMKFAFVLAKR